MQTTVTIDKALYEKALEMAEPGLNKADLFRQALSTFVRVQAAKRLAALDGEAPDIKEVPRRRDRSFQVSQRGFGDADSRRRMRNVDTH